MMIRSGLLVLGLLFVVGVTDARGQDSDEMKRLKTQVELLQAKLEVANLKIEKLEAENQKLKTGSGAEGKGKKSLSERLPVGLAAVGTFKLPGTNGEVGTATLTVTERDGNNIKGTYASKAQGAKEANPGFTFDGTISGDTLTVKSVGSAARKTMTVSLRGDSLDGTMVVIDRGTSARVSFSLDK